MAKPAARKSEPPTDITLPVLTPLGAADLAAHGDYDAVLVADADLAGLHLEGAAFLASHLDRCGLDEAVLRRGRLAECVLTEVHAVSLDVADAVWRETLVVDPRIGALSAPGATWDNIRIRGGKLDFVNLSGAKLTDVVFERCVIGELDLGQTQVQRLRFDGVKLGVLDCTGARLVDADFTGAEIGAVRGIDGLRGATFSTSQLLDLAPLLAAHLGVRIRAD